MGTTGAGKSTLTSGFCNEKLVIITDQNTGDIKV